MKASIVHKTSSGGSMETVFDLAGLHRAVTAWKAEGASIAFVPTMGNLHRGHYSLLERASELADKTIVSIFVNPIQFGKGEDYDSYPSTLEGDSDGLAVKNLDLLFAPDLKQLYPSGVDTDTRVVVPDLIFFVADFDLSIFQALPPLSPSFLLIPSLTLRCLVKKTINNC
jgi:cytidyltransferase-like protein